ncbi:hypothetical protein [Clostridium sp. AF32-12BH]|uniref:hypothetical protein n=1 Tax=Clostridium sp. AF32-12BH TaxID=2292006 RepID=UPI001A9B11CD|nr:hypothetical protein [Clostridium sp. AF32-12BH]
MISIRIRLKVWTGLSIHKFNVSFGDGHTETGTFVFGSGIGKFLGKVIEKFFLK